MPAIGVSLKIDEPWTTTSGSGTGEVLARSNVVLEGYWEQPEESERALKDGWFHTGDGGVIGEDGYLTISDRKKDVIITGGENVSSIEVEDVIFSHPAVAEVAVIGVPDEKWGETIKALVVLEAGPGGHRGGADPLVQGQGRRLQGADLGGVPRRAGPDRHRQAAEVQAAGAVLGGPRPAGQLKPRDVPTLSSLVDLLHGWYPPATADSWDAVGLVAGDPEQDVRKVLFAVDPARPVAEEAAAWGADLLVVHHPLFLKGVHGVARTTPKGRTLGVLQDAGCALLTAHTNADQAVAGVSEALAAALGLTDLRPIASAASQRLDKLTTYVPVGDADRVRQALASAGAGVVGDYDNASFSSPGEGRFRPLEGAHPVIGEVGSLEVVAEVRIECVLPRGARATVVAAMLAAHPYEEPAYDVVELADPGTAATGSGRLGTVEETTLGAFADHVAARAAGHRPRRAGGRRPGRGRSDGWPCAAERATSSSMPFAAPPPTSTSPATCATTRPASSLSRTVRRWSTSRTGRRSRPGCRWWRGGSGPRWGLRWRPGSAHCAPTRGRCTYHRTHRRRALKADPAAQLALLDLQELDSRADLLRHQRATLPELAEITTLATSRAELDGRRRDAQIVGRRPDRRAGQGRCRRRAGQGPAQARPGPDGPGADQQPQGPRADAGRADLAAAADHQPRGRRARGDGAPRGRPAGPRLAHPAGRRGRRAARRARRGPRRPDRGARPRARRPSRPSAGPPRPAIPEDLLALYEKLRVSRNGVAVGALRRPRVQRLPALARPDRARRDPGRRRPTR